MACIRCQVLVATERRQDCGPCTDLLLTSLVVLAGLRLDTLPWLGHSSKLLDEVVLGELLVERIMSALGGLLGRYAGHGRIGNGCGWSLVAASLRRNPVAGERAHPLTPELSSLPSTTSLPLASVACPRTERTLPSTCLKHRSERGTSTRSSSQVSTPHPFAPPVSRPPPSARRSELIRPLASCSASLQ